MPSSALLTTDGLRPRPIGRFLSSIRRSFHQPQNNERERRHRKNVRAFFDFGVAIDAT
jgi:hypothetical protein